MKRALAWTAVVLGLLVCLALASQYSHVRSWAAVHTGSSNVAGVAPNYNFWSGFGSDLGEYVVVAGVASGVYHMAKKNNCHTHKCWRIGSLPVAGGYKVCKRHHLDITGAKPTIEHLRARHQEQKLNLLGYTGHDEHNLTHHGPEQDVAGDSA